MAAPPRGVGTPTFTPTPPDPTEFKDWREFARALAVFYSDQTKVLQAVQPTAVQLLHVDVTKAKALQDGLLVFNPVDKLAMISIGGEWLAIPAGLAYAAMRLSGSTAGANITDVFTKVDKFDQNQIVSRRVTVDLANDWFIPTFTGIYELLFGFSIEHNNLGTARELRVRLRSLDSAFVSATLTVPTPGATRFTSFSVPLMLDVTSAILNQRLIVEIAAGTGQTYSTVTWHLCSLSFLRMFPPPPVP